MAYGSSTIGGGIAGGTLGATVGSVVPGIGTAIGAGVGTAIGAGGGLLEDIFNSGNGASQRGTLRPNQQNLQDSLINLIQQRLSGQGGLSPISQNAMQRFNTQTVPGLAERFTSLGAGSQGSSAFAGQLGAAGGDLQNELAGLDWQQILQLIGPALGQSSENIQENMGPGFGETAGNAVLENLPAILKYLQSQQPATAGSGTGIKDLLARTHQQNPMSPGNNYMNRLGGSPQQFASQYGIGVL